MRQYKFIYGIALMLCCSLGTLADNYFIINQVMYDTPLNEQSNISPAFNGEFVELYNAGMSDVSLQGWQLRGDGQTEVWTFTVSDTIKAGGYLLIACRRGSTNNFKLSDLYNGALNKPVIYQNKILLTNRGENITLYNAQNETVDRMYYDGTSNQSNPDRLHAENPNGIAGDSCVSLHRTGVEFDEDGKVIPGTSLWQKAIVSFSRHMLPYDSYQEDYLFGEQSLPETENFVLSIVPLDPTTRINVNEGQVSVSSGVRVQTKLAYMDGLGRQEELIALGISPYQEDVVSLNEFYGARKVARQWLSVAKETNGQRTNIADLQSQAQTDYADSRPYSETQYENSSRRRPVAHLRPGASYAYAPATQAYNLNNSDDQVRIYTVDNANGKLHTDGTYYRAGTLYKTTSADEDGKSATTYTDKEGKKILEVRNGSRTYYVYDDLGRLRFVLPNLPASKLSNGDYDQESNSTLKATAYCYRYDYAGNMVYKRLPGCAAQYMVYDKLGQLILKQDGNQRVKNKWTLCAYDSIGRNLYMAEIPITTGHDQLISQFANLWSVEHYGSGQQNVIPGIGYASTILDIGNDYRLLTVNYYDNYDFLTNQPELTFVQEAGYGTPHDNAIGLLTGTRVYSLSEAGCSTATTYYYDARGQVVQTRSIGGIGGPTTTSTEYLFDGSVAQKLTKRGTDNDLIREHYCYTYDHAGRPLQVNYQLNNDEEITLSSFSYDSIGRLAQNLLYKNKDTVRYSYDMRNMLTETRNKHFSERLYYTDNLPSGVNACHNGNISVSHIANNDTAFTFAYNYDAQNRLLASNLMTDFSSAYSEQFTYDPAGNILSLIRFSDNRKIDDLAYSYTNDGHQLLSITDNGQPADRYEVIEFPNGDQADTIMRYDANGNMICDSARFISAIHYNIFNLPDTIQFINGNQIVNLYDAVGRKYKSIVYIVPETAVTPQYEIVHYTFDVDTINYLVTEYAGNIETRYTKTDTLTRRIFNSIGYREDSLYYHYIKDHLGNICAVLNSVANTLVQSTMYYASGVPMAQSTNRDKQPYLYNGKEFIEAHSWNTYDYGFRSYYATIGRFTSMDPLAEQTPWQSPYAYANNNFINNIDWMGLGGMYGGFSQGGGPYDIWGSISMSGFGSQILDYIILDEDGVVLDADLTHPDRGIYQINRILYENYLKYVINGNKLLYAQIFGTQIGVHRDLTSGTVFPGMIFDQSWYDFMATLGVASSFYLPTPDFTPEPVTGKIRPAQLPYDAYLELLYAKHEQFQPMDYMQYYNSYEKGMITNPVIQSVAVGGLGVMAVEISTGIYWALQYNLSLQTGVGLVEGAMYGYLGAGPDVPYLYEPSIGQVICDFGSWLYGMYNK